MRTVVYPDRIKLVPENPLEAQALSLWAEGEAVIGKSREQLTWDAGGFNSRLTDADVMHDLTIKFVAKTAH